MNSNNTAHVAIKKVVNGGYGLARHPGGKNVLVQFALPGEVVSLALVARKRQLDLARVEDVVRAHEGRILPPCPYYGSCGGCDLQHADYPTQCLLKQQIIRDLLQRSGSPPLKELSSRVEPVIEAPRPLGYRQRIRLKVDRQKQVGFNRFRSHTIIPVNYCLLAPDAINNCLAGLSASSSFNELAAITEEIEILFNPLDTTLCLIIMLTRPPRPADRLHAGNLCRELQRVSRVFLGGKTFAQEGPFCMNGEKDNNRLGMVLPLKPPLKLVWEAGGFCQVNTGQNSKLIELVLELAAPAPSDRVLDLFCGMGNFSIPLARQSAFVTGIESQGSAIRSAAVNSNQNGLLNTSFIKSDVRKGCSDLLSQQLTFDILICDPPRQGLKDMVTSIGQLCDHRLVYISCDPATLCRDLAGLTSGGFTVRKVQPIDMFPQTHHIETVVLLEKY